MAKGDADKQRGRIQQGTTLKRNLRVRTHWIKNEDQSSTNSSIKPEFWKRMTGGAKDEFEGQRLKMKEYPSFKKQHRAPQWSKIFSFNHIANSKSHRFTVEEKSTALYISNA